MTDAWAEKTSSPRHIGGRFRTNSSFYPTRASSVEILTGIKRMVWLANVSRSRIYVEHSSIPGVLLPSPYFV